MTDSPVARAAELAALGHREGVRDPADPAVVELRDALSDPDPRVRVAALGALARVGPPDVVRVAWDGARLDVAPVVRRRAAELGAQLVPPPVDALVAFLDDADVLVVEGAAWSLGEIGAALPPSAVRALAQTTTGHADALAREAAVAALGACGSTDGLAAILTATSDRPAVRRRAVLALAPFEGPDVDAALLRAADDRDWQVRQAAEDLTTPDTSGGDPGVADG